MTPSTDRVQQALHALAGAQARLPVVRLLPGDRQRLGGLLLPLGPALVRLVAEALAGDAEAFAALPVTAAELRGRQDEADAWRRLRTALLLCAERAGDQVLSCQADALKTAQAILDEVGAERGRMGDREGRLRRRRKLALGPAGLALFAYHRKLAPPRRPRPASSALSRRRGAVLLEQAFCRHLARAGAAAEKGSAVLAAAIARAEELPTPAAKAQTPTRSGPVNIKERFIADITGKAPPGAAPPAPIPTAQLAREAETVADLFAGCPDPGLDAEQQKKLLTPGSTLWPQVLALCAEGLRARPAFADARGVSVQVCEDTVAQDSAISQVIKGAGDLHAAATAAAAATARDGRARGSKVLQAAVGVINDPADPAAAAETELQFAEAFRLHEEGAPGEAAALRRERRLRPLREARDRTREETAQLRLIDRFLVQSGDQGGDHE